MRPTREIPAIIVEASEDDRFVMSLVETLARRQHTPLELVRSIGAPSERGQALISRPRPKAVVGAGSERPESFEAPRSAFGATLTKTGSPMGQAGCQTLAAFRRNLGLCHKMH